jgi:hypothetical protein
VFRILSRTVCGVIAAAAILSASAAHATATHDIKPEPVQGFRYEIVPTDDSTATKRFRARSSRA